MVEANMNGSEIGNSVQSIKLKPHEVKFFDAEF